MDPHEPAGFAAKRPAEEESDLSDESEKIGLKDISVDASNLYREEVYTDLQVATIRCMSPVQADGSPDASRKALYSVQTTLMSQAGPVPVQAPVEAANLEEAVAKFPEAINEAVERLIEEAREVQRQEASRIVVPGQRAGPKIQF